MLACLSLCTFLTVALGQSTAPAKVVGSLFDQTLSTQGGTIAYFGVVASGAPPITYQWKKNGAPLANSARISGATSANLSLSSLEVGDDANYSVTVTNAFGSDTSNSAHLTIKDIRITTPPANQVVTSGGTATFSVVVSATDPVTYEWTKVGESGSKGNSSVLTIQNVQPSHAGSYSLWISSAAGILTPAPVTLTVGAPPSLSTGPWAGTSGLVGSGLFLGAGAAGSGPFSYQWYKNGTLIPGATGAIIEFSNAQLSDSGSYHTVITNAFGSVSTPTRQVAVFAVNFVGATSRVFDGSSTTVTATTIPAGLAHQVTYHDGSAFLPAGERPRAPGTYAAVVTVKDGAYDGVANAHFTISAAPITVQLSALEQTYNGSPRSVIASGTPSDQPLTVEYPGLGGQLPVNAGSYPFIVRSANPNFTAVVSQTQTLVIKKADQSIAILQPPGTPVVGTPISLDATTSSGLGGVFYQIVSGNGTMNGIQLTLADNNPVTVRATQSGNSNYNSASADLIVTAGKQNQTITFPPLANRLLSATPFPLTATASSGLPVTYSIMSGPATINGDTVTLTGVAGTVVVRATQAGSALFNAAPFLEQSFIVSSAALPVITQQPTNVVAREGQPATLQVVAEGGAPLTYKWVRNGVDVPLGTSSTLTLPEPQSSTGTYRVVVSNSAGSVTSDPAVVTVILLPRWQTEIFPQTAAVGGQVTFTVDVSGTPPFTYQWFKNNQLIAAAAGPTLQLLNIQLSDAGSYHVQVTNAASTSPLIGLPAVLTVTGGTSPPAGGGGGGGGVVVVSPPVLLPPTPPAGVSVAPSITAQPASVSRTAGEAAVFSISATGTAPLGYQWFKDGSLVPGATGATLTLSNLQLAGAGSYRVTVSNAVGSVTSATAVLSVSPPSYAGVYFGTFANATGSWALYVSANGTGTFVAYLIETKRAIVQAVTVASDGSFAVQAVASLPLVGPTLATAPGGSQPPRAGEQELKFSGRIAAGAVSGELIGMGVTFSGAVDSATGNQAAGFYTAPAIGASSGATYAIVGGSGNIVVVSTSGGAADVATGKLDGQGSFSGMTAGGLPLALNVDPATSAVSGTVGAANGGSTAFAGLAGGVSSTARLINLSVRSFAGAGDRALAIGFVTGGGGKQVLLRGVGPSLAQFSVAGALAEPVLELFHGDGHMLQKNSAWGGGTALSAAFARLGAFPLTANSADAALLVDLEAGASTAQLSSRTATQGIALVEVYDADTGTPSSRFVNMSARTQVGTGDEALTVGFVVSGNAPVKVLVRGIGPTLAQFGVTGTLADPELTIFDAERKSLFRNDDWAGAASLVEAFRQAGAFSLSLASKDAAFLITLLPGAYTVRLSGIANTVGVALVEVYELR